jgi:hypothetical protein
MALVEEIVDIEYRMFMNVNAREEATCREDAEAFRMHRKSQLTVWSKATLESYLKDLTEAEEAGKNLMTVKYARMENLIPPENTSGYIDKITEILIPWQEEFIRRYPRIMQRGRPWRSSEETGGMVSFETYLRCELETYSERTLSSLYDDVRRYREEGKNMSRESYEYLVRALGYESLDQVESSLP